jgi:hypothetical protein
MRGITFFTVLFKKDDTYSTELYIEQNTENFRVCLELKPLLGIVKYTQNDFM